MRKIIPAALLILLTILTGCAREDTPEAALEDIKVAIEQYDYEKFSARVNVNGLLDAAYDDATVELARRAKEFGAAYPDDPFFKNTGEDIMSYNELNRAEHMKFVREVVSACFARGLTAPSDFNEDTLTGTAAELRNYYETAQSTLESVNVEGARAELRLKLNLQSKYADAKFDLPLTLEFERDGERWRLDRVGHVEELLLPLVDIAEILWPDQFKF